MVFGGKFVLEDIYLRYVKILLVMKVIVVDKIIFVELLLCKKIKYSVNKIV